MTLGNGPEQVTPEQAALNVYNIAAVCIHRVSNAYKAGGEIAENLKNRTDNAQSRLTGLSYKTQTYGAIYNGFKHIETQKIIDLVRNPDMPLKEKVSNIASHVGQNFSHECTVALGITLGKAALLGALVASAAPGSVLAGAYLACKYGSRMLQGGAEYFLSSPQGHGMEASMADKIKNAKIFTKNFWRAHTGQDPEYAKMHDISEKMDHAAHAPAHAHEHGHGHGHHHEKAHATLKGDLKALRDYVSHPLETIKNVCTAIKEDCQALHGFAMRGMETMRQSISRFAAPKQAAPDMTPAVIPVESGPATPQKMARIFKNNGPSA